MLKNQISFAQSVVRILHSQFFALPWTAKLFSIVPFRTTACSQTVSTSYLILFSTKNNPNDCVSMTIISQNVHYYTRFRAV